jgi:chromosomal replication initiator protein
MLRSRHGAWTAPRRVPAAPFAIRRSHPSPRSITPAQPPQLAHVWAKVRTELRRLVDDHAAELWLDPLEPVELDGSRLVLATDPALRDWIETRFGRHLHEAVDSVLGGETELELVAGGTARGDAPAAPTTPVPDHDVLSPKLTFEQFVIGDSNRFAHAAALAVAELPGQAYNPLFIYGPPGVGKTHLLHSIGNYVRQFGAGLTVRATTAERFTTDFVTALRTGALDSFKGRFRRADVLLIDDVQFLERKARTEEEFFHTFNALHETGSQLVLTSDRLPRDLDALEERMRERFEAGLVADIAAPDRAVRHAVLRKRVQHDEISLAESAALDVIADRVTENVRALEGALIRVVAFHSLTGRRLDAALAEEVLDGLYPAPRGRIAQPTAPTIDLIQQLTCEAFGITLEELVSHERTARVAWPRQVAMYLCREHTDQSLPAIGRRFGGRNHTTVMHACRRTSNRLSSDQDAFDAVHSLSSRLRGTP